jgi:hypothetical protein
VALLGFGSVFNTNAPVRFRDFHRIYGRANLFCILFCALAQATGSGVMQGADAAAEGAAKQAGENAAGQVMQNMGVMPASPAASPASQKINGGAVLDKARARGCGIIAA